MTTTQLKKLSQAKRTVYQIICEFKCLKPIGGQILTCIALAKAGLIHQNSDGSYVLSGEAVALPKKYKHPREIVDELLSEAASKPVPVAIMEPETEFKRRFKRVEAIYDNPSREDHVSKWIQQAVTPDEKTIVKVKCLQEWQMKYIMHNHEQKTAQEMADKLKVAEMAVKLFCQANAIVPVPTRPKSKRKPVDSFHVIPESKRLRMKRIGYNPQNKTA